MQILNPNIAKFSNRDFYKGSQDKIRRLEKIGMIFIDGFNFAMSINNFDKLVIALNEKDREFVGFAYEGAAMALEMKDIMMPWKTNRLKKFLEGYGNENIYMIHVGAGWAYAKMPFNPSKRINKLDALLKYLAIDGYGFHNGYFKTQQYVYNKKRPQYFSGYELRVFYQGLGRSLWFVECAEVDRITITINHFPLEFRTDLWSGIGLASSYAGGATEDDLQKLKENGKRYLPQLAQGAAFAAKARIRADNLVPHTNMACNIFCETTAEEAAKITDEALIDLPYDKEKPAYEIWRMRIHKQFSHHALIKH